MGGYSLMSLCSCNSLCRVGAGTHTGCPISKNAGALQRPSQTRGWQEFGETTRMGQVWARDIARCIPVLHLLAPPLLRPSVCDMLSPLPLEPLRSGAAKGGFQSTKLLGPCGDPSSETTCTCSTPVVQRCVSHILEHPVSALGAPGTNAVGSWMETGHPLLHNKAAVGSVRGLHEGSWMPDMILWRQTHPAAAGCAPGGWRWWRWPQ